MSNKYKNIFWFGIAAMLIFAPIARGAVRLWSITPVLLISYGLIFIWLWRVNNSKTPERQEMKWSALDKPIIVFGILAVISFVFSIYKHDSFYALVRLFSYIGIYYLVLNNFGHSMRRRVIALVIFIGTALSFYGLLQYFGVLSHSWWGPQDLLAATYVNHNHFSGYLELVIPVTIGWLMRQKTISKRQKIITSMALAIMVIAFIAAQSRGAWFCLGISLFVMNVVLVKKKILRKITLIIFLVSAALIFSLAYLNEGLVSKRIETITSVDTGDASLQTRVKIWRGTVEMIKQSPLIGTGIGTFIWGFPRFRPEGLYVQANFAHNDYLQTAAEMGVLAVLVMIWLLVVAIGRGLTMKGFHPVRIGCAIGILSLALHGLVDFNFHIPANMLLFTVYAAIIMQETE